MAFRWACFGTGRKALFRCRSCAGLGSRCALFGTERFAFVRADRNSAAGTDHVAGELGKAFRIEIRKEEEIARKIEV